MTLIAIVVGAAVGAPLRYLVDRAVTARAGHAAFPWGLLVVNVAGSAIAGVVIALTDGTARELLLIGFCGTFTTFSGFGWEASRLWPGARRAFWATVIGMPIACTAAFLAAWSLLG